MEKISKNNLYHEIKSILEEARKSAYRAVNFSMVLAYYQIGKLIVEEEQEGKKRAEYGEALLADLSKRLTADFGKGFSVAGLKNYRQFYITFSNSEKRSALRSKLSAEGEFPKGSALRSESFKKETEPERHSLSDQLKENDPALHYPLRKELTWTHYRLLMRVENEAARNYYIEETIAQNWSTRLNRRLKE